MFRRLIPVLLVTTLFAIATGISPAAGSSKVSSSARAKAALDHIESVLKGAKGLTFQSLMSVIVETPPGNTAEHESYSVTGTFQHPVYVRFDEVRAGKTLLTISSNPEHLYVYSPISNIYLDCGNVPVYFAVADMLTSGGATDDKQAPASEEVGYFPDIWAYFFDSGYGSASPWGNIEGHEPKTSQSISQAWWKGQHLPCLKLFLRGDTYIVTWLLYLNPKTGLPWHTVMTADGPAVTGSQKGRSHISLTEDYSVFKPSYQALPESAFQFVPPDGSGPYPNNEEEPGKPL